jgi:hypothetical protein
MLRHLTVKRGVYNSGTAVYILVWKFGLLKNKFGKYNKFLVDFFIQLCGDFAQVDLDILRRPFH